ncbi:hypothetical protein R1sor_000546 [Riccia sorocarpa]|uniref:U-box domain-containing protein n=1 Tax=Riccia sorocarpa TaxID=122646 RepID=A0ABD3GXD5_9MARC
MAGVIADLSDQITRLIHYLEKVKDLTGYDVGLQAEISNFMRTLSTNLEYLKTSLPHTVSTDAIGLHANEVAEANRFMGECLEQDQIKRIWSARETRTTLESLRQKLASCFHLAFFITSLDVTIEGQHRASDFQQRLLKLYFTHVSDALAARGQLQTLLQPLASEIKRQDKKLEELIEFVERGGAASTGIATDLDQSTDTQKFFADVMATVEQLHSNIPHPSASSSRSNEEDSSSSSDGSMEELINDPITKEIMVDPVKGSDGYTYDRWTIVDNDLVVSPITGKPLSIVCDDCTLRSWLFTKFHDQKLEEKFRGLREEYRRTTLDLVTEGHDAEALERLENVLKWAPQDSECQELHRKLSSRLEEWRSRASFPRFESSFDPVSITAKEATVSPRPSMTTAMQPDSLPLVDGEAGGEASTGPSLSLWLTKSPTPSSSTQNESVSAGEPNVVPSVGEDSLTQRDLEAGTGANWESQLDHDPPRLDKGTLGRVF